MKRKNKLIIRTTVMNSLSNNFKGKTTTMDWSTKKGLMICYMYINYKNNFLLLCLISTFIFHLCNKF